MGNIELNPDDLVGGDVRIAENKFPNLQFIRITDFAQSEFQIGYQALWEEFAAAGEMESIESTKNRLGWDPQKPEIKEYPMLGDLVVVKENERCVAVSNHTAIVDMTESSPRLNVLFNHLWVGPEFRRTGLSCWMRTMPWHTARRCLALLRLKVTTPVTVVAEVEHNSLQDTIQLQRLLSWEKAGYLKLNPKKAPYAQPDFRLQQENIVCGRKVNCLPLALLILQKNLEGKRSMRAKEVKKIVTSLHNFYDRISEVWRMAPVWDTLKLYPIDSEEIELMAPSLKE